MNLHETFKASRISIPRCVTTRIDAQCLRVSIAAPSSNKACTLILAAHRAGVCPGLVTLLMTEGAGKVGSWPLPWPACNKKRRRQVPQVRPRHSRPSLRDGVTIYTRSSRGPAVLPPSFATMHQHHRRLGISSGMPEPRDFTVASRSFVRTRHSRCDPTRPPHPAPGVRDDREAPPQRDGMRGGNHNFGKYAIEISCARGSAG